MNIDRTSIRLLRDEINNALVELGKKHGLQIDAGSASFLPGKNVTFKLECAVIGADGQAASKEAENFKAYCSLYGLRPEQLNGSFVYNGKRWKIVGCAPRSHKYPILCEDQNGKVFKLPAHAAKDAK